MTDAMQTSMTAPTASVPRKSRRRWYILGFLLLVAATPVAWYVIAGWRGDRAMAELLAEMDADDPGWRWPDIIANLEPLAGEANCAAQIGKVNSLARTPGTFDPGPKWHSAAIVQNARLTDDQANAVQAAFAKCDPALRDEARKFKDLPRGCFQIPEVGNPSDSYIVEVQKSRTAAHVLECDAALRAHEGDLDGAAESCQALLNMTGVFHDHPNLIGLLVRIAEQSIAVHAVERTLGQGTVAGPQLKKLQELLQREADDDGMYAAIRGEQASSYQLYLNLRDGTTTLSTMLGNGKAGGLIDANLARLVDAFPNVLLKDYPDYLRTMNANVRACKLEPAQRAEELQKIEQKARTEGNMLSRMLLPGVLKVSEASMRSQANLRCATVAVAAERYRLGNGVWPRTLDDLVKDGLLAKVPADPYDNKPLRWKRTPTGAVVYSVYRDKIDNGGKLDRSHASADGIDFGFELWDGPKMRGVPPPVEGK